jgi:hypothetical protein
MRRIWFWVFGVVAVAAAFATDAEAGRAQCKTKLCAHLALSFPAELHEFATVRRWESDGTIYYTAIGLAPDADQIFGELLEALGQRAGLSIQRATPDQMRSVRITAVAIDDPAVQKDFKRVSTFTGDVHTLQQAMALADRRLAAVEYRPRGADLIYAPNGGSAQGRITRCVLNFRAKQLEGAELGFTLASEIYQCLTGFPKSNAVISIGNSAPSVTLLAPPYAKLSSLDAALLRIVYEPGDALFNVQQDELVARLETRLRAEGFQDDGSKK